MAQDKKIEGVTHERIETNNFLMIVLIVLPYVLHVNPVGVYLDVTAGNVANLLFPFRVS